MDELFEYLLTSSPAGVATEGPAVSASEDTPPTRQPADIARLEDVFGLLVERLRDERVRREILQILFRP